MTNHKLTLFLFSAIAVATVVPTFAVAPRVRKPAQVITGSIVDVADGDTVWLSTAPTSTSAKLIKVRLHYADCPEIGHRKGEPDQPYGREAVEYVKKEWLNKSVVATVHGVSYGRPIVDVVEKGTGKNLALDLVRLGLAEVDPRFHPPKAFTEAQAAALEKRVGVFKDTKTPVAPWLWRQQQRNKEN